MIDEATEPQELLQNIEEIKLWQESITMMNMSAFPPFVVDRAQPFLLKMGISSLFGHCGNITPVLATKPI